MTRKDYTALATILARAHYRFGMNDAPDETAHRTEQALAFLTTEIAAMCYADNPRFNGATFAKAITRQVKANRDGTAPPVSPPLPAWDEKLSRA